MHSIKQIGERFWYMTPEFENDRPVLGMVVGRNKTLMIDAGNSESHAQYFLNELRKREIAGPDFVALTHWHWDHIFGLSALTDAVSIASKATKKEMEKLLPYSWSDEALAARVKEGTEIQFCADAIKKEYASQRDIKIILPKMIFDYRLEIDLGGVTCLVQQVGGSHASDSVVVYVKEEKILFLGDCICADIYAKNRNYKIDETLRLLDRLAAFDADTYVLSHGLPISKNEFEQEITMLRAIATLTDRLKGNIQHVMETYEKLVERELTEDELEVIHEFAMGYFFRSVAHSI
ncbi:Glyoxylase, beta-lactamase superfamily II [Paenibacillus sp. UNCCL117]|uniref:MBL fold metallo-hydrolase n=1 Tax=unclassified Paenibacillus TaxID=185978 RepID=UPI0008918D1C|nr:MULTISPECIES: MBL fold metallo-hydrolase [unclassified Paenibacillus]SDC27085.1 Glyoxylase, beta-lactamase superfamily II [Paenibacillus sp. cl123]SFW20258.1 Glyoxylase, beta-lactamase superfamily II [Paenibacillus sp. UNCCL117]